MAKYDEFDDEGSRFEPLKRVLGARHIAGLAVILIVVTLGYMAFGGIGDGSSRDVALIKADQTPYKIPPEDKGGMAVPNQNSTIFETLSGDDNSTARVENLLDDSEEPMTKADIPTPEAPNTAAPIKDTATDEVKTAMIDPAADTIKPEPMPAPPETGEIANTEPSAAPVEDVAKPEPVVAPVVKVEEKVEPKKVEVKKEEPKKEEAAKPKTTGSKSLQFAAVKSDAEARALWSKLQAKNPELNAYTVRVERADLADKGIFYRVKIAGLSDDTAHSLCSKVKSRGGSCMVVK